MPSENENQSSKPKILIVEDDLDIANVYSLKFEKEDFEVYVSANGEEGLAKAKAWLPDAILLDVMLPKIDGFEVLKQIKAYRKTRDIPVIIWTNLSQSEEARKAKELGADDYLVKVFNMPAEVVEKVKSIMIQ